MDNGACRIACVRPEVENQEGEDVIVYHYRIAFKGACVSALEVEECNLFPTREAAQSLCDKWNSYPSDETKGGE